MLMQDFHELCVRLVVAGDGDGGDRRGSLFEDLAREIIISSLNLTPQDIPIQPRTKLRKIMRELRDYGDVDFAFTRENVLIHLDMKSYTRSIADFRGDYLAIQKRIARLSHEMNAKIQPRGVKLLEFVQRMRPNVHTVLNFLCVGIVEFVPATALELRYGDEPRVLTPVEIVELMKDHDRFAALVAKSK